MQRKPKLAIRLYFAGTRLLHRFMMLSDAVFTGFWLGVLRRSDLDEIDESYYHAQKMYQDEGYNRSGLREWERKVVEKYFGDARTLLVTSAGGGREVLALMRMGYRVDAFECNAALARYANELLTAEGLPAAVQCAERDSCPASDRRYDGVIVGWGAFMLTQGEERRICFLRQLREQMRTGVPVLISFFARSPRERRFRVIQLTGNLLRRLQGRAPLETGDDLSPNFVHHCDRAEIERTLLAAGFEPVFFETREYGHAVGIAMPTSTPALTAEPLAARIS